MSCPRGKNCTDFHTSFYEQVLIFENTKRAFALHSWFHTIFSIQHPETANHFQVEWHRNKKTNEDDLVVQCDSDLFNISQLLILFNDDLEQDLGKEGKA